MIARSTRNQDVEFTEKLVGIIDVGKVLDWIRGEFSPSDVFPENDLRQWAFDNGFVEES